MSLHHEASGVTDAERRRFLNDARRLRGLLSASQLVTEELDLEDVLRNIAEAAVTLVDARYGALGVIDAEGRLERFIHVGMPQELVDDIGHLPEGHGVLGAVIESSCPMRLEDLTADPRAVGFPAHHPPMRTFLGVPITIGGQKYGNLYLTDRASGVFTEEDEDLVIALAATAATAITNARLYDQARRAQRISAALSDVTAVLLESAQSDIFGVLAENAAALAESELACVVRPGAEEKTLYIAAVHGEGVSRIQGRSIPLVDPVLAGALNGERGISAYDRTKPPPFGSDTPSGSTIAVPLIVSGAPVGALCVTREVDSPPFESGDLAMMAEFVAQAGTAVALAQARVDRQRLEVTEDRARTARDLHDHVIQRLFGTGLGLQALACAHPAHEPVLEEHISAIDAAIADIRTAIFTLQTRGSSQVARHRILDVVTEFGSQFTTAPKVTLNGPIDLMITGELLDDTVAVLRETLTNVSRHAQAETVEVEIIASGGEVTVLVKDDGVGLSPGIGRASGIDNLHKRAVARGGAFVLESGDTGGTWARWHVPITPGMPE